MEANVQKAQWLTCSDVGPESHQSMTAEHHPYLMTKNQAHLENAGRDTDTALVNALPKIWYVPVCWYKVLSALLKLLLASASAGMLTHSEHRTASDQCGADRLIFWCDLEKLLPLSMCLHKLFSNKGKTDTTDNMMFKHHKNYFSSMTLKKRKIIRKLPALVSYS